MNLKEIQELIRFVSKSEVTEVEIEKDGFKLSIKTDKQLVAQAPVYQAVVAAAPAPVAAQAPVAPAVQPAAAPTAQPADSNEAKYVTIKSPMIGTFYRSSGPDKDAFVKVGDAVEKGQVICIIEAMKLFNEIESDVKGKIVKVLVDNASPVEYDQPLFLVDPS